MVLSRRAMTCSSSMHGKESSSNELVRSQLAHFEDLIGPRIRLDGPLLFVSAPAAQAIGMALHELATNAGKYGALANRTGQVKIKWSLDHAEAGKRPSS